MNFVFCDQAVEDAKNAWRLMAPAQREEFIRWAKPSREYVKATIPKELRWQIWNRDGFKCQYCGSTSNLSVDHIVAESRGGTLDESNLVTACISCNSAKGATEFRSFMVRRKLTEILRRAESEIYAVRPTRDELFFAADFFRKLASDLDRAAAQMEDGE